MRSLGALDVEEELLSVGRPGAVVARDPLDDEVEGPDARVALDGTVPPPEAGAWGAFGVGAGGAGVVGGSGSGGGSGGGVCGSGGSFGTGGDGGNGGGN